MAKAQAGLLPDTAPCAVPRQRCSQFFAVPATPPPLGLERSNDPPPAPSQVPLSREADQGATRPFGFHLRIQQRRGVSPAIGRVAVFQIGGAAVCQRFGE
ncbi:hypothetical protein HDV63DRAFT_360523 [Trichoderma sp. SZMC 28014]